MTVATLTLTCLIFLALGWESSTMRVLALSIAAVVCVASSNGGTTAQSLKTGFLVGGTPRLNQWTILIGAITSALVIGGTLLAFNAAGTVYSEKPENLPTLALTPDERGLLPEKETYKGETYLVWDTHRDTFAARSGFTPRPELAKRRRGAIPRRSRHRPGALAGGSRHHGQARRDRRRRQGQARLRRAQDPGDGHHHHRRAGAQAELGAWC